jgi:AAA15 family ATPase/GTPase
MIAEFSIENFFSIKSTQKISFEPSADTFMSDEYSYEVKDGVRLLKVGIIYGANASGKTNILNAIEFFKMLVLRMPKDRTEKTGVVPFMLDDTSRNEKPIATTAGKVITSMICSKIHLVIALWRGSDTRLHARIIFHT